MPNSVACEYCGKPVQPGCATVETVEEWAHYFCSETCKIACGEQSPLEAEEDV
jgi:ribosomal protein L24E